MSGGSFEIVGEPWRVPLGGHETAVWRYGPHDGIPVVAAHSAGLDGRSFGALASILAAEGYQVFALDQRGHGRSTAPSSTVSLGAMAEDLAEVAVQICRLTSSPFGSLHLVGHSVGGAIAGIAAAEHPGLWASVSIVASPPRGMPVFLERAIEARERGLLDVIAPTLERWFTIDDDHQAEAIAYARRCLTAMQTEAWAALWESFSGFAGFSLLPETIRTFCVVGSRDVSTPEPAVRAVEGSLGGSRHPLGVAVVPGAPHQIVLTHAAALGALLLSRALDERPGR